MTAQTIESGTAKDFPTAREMKGTAPWRWLEKGWADYRRRPGLAAGYGILFVALGYGIIFGLKAVGLFAAIPVAIGSFALIGPLMAVGLYALARSLERGENPSWRDVLLVKAVSPVQVAYVGVIMLVGLFVWTICAVGLLAIFAGTNYVRPEDFLGFATSTLPGLTLLSIGTLVGGFIAFGIFAITAFSIPMLLDRDTDFATAIGASVTAVTRQPKTMLLWAWIIAASVVIGAATLLFGFILLFPLIGLATWHGYREAFGD